MRGYLLAILALVQASCASRDLWPVERVDPETAVHVTVMADPWTYALDDSTRPADARDFLSIAVVETNRAGARAYWLNAVSWSTIDRSASPDRRIALPAANVRLGGSADALELAPDAGGRAAAGLSEPAFSVPADRFTEAWYPLSEDEIARIAAGAPSAVALVGGAGRIETYTVWQANPGAMSEFLKATGLSP